MSSSSDREELKVPNELGRLSSLIDEKPEVFASGDKDIQDAALAAAKFIFDLTLKSESRAQSHLADLLQSIEPTQAPQTRAQARSAAQPEKRQTPSLNHAILNETPLSALFVDGMDEEQVWAQLELKAKNVCETLEKAFDAGDVDARGNLELDDEEEEEPLELSPEEVEMLENMEGFKGWDSDSEEEDDEEEDEEEDSESAEEEDLEENVTELRDPSSEEGDSDEEEEMDLDAGPSSGRASQHRSRGKRHAELDDGFFSLADFNAEIEEAESKSVSRGSLSKGSDDEDSEEDDPVDLFAPVDDDEHLDETINEEDGEAHYKDFFEPPPKPARPAKRKAVAAPSLPAKKSIVRFNDQVKVKTIKGRGKGKSLSSVDLRTGQVADEDDDDNDDDGEIGLSEEFSFEDESGSENGSDHESSLEDENDEGREAVERLKDDLFADDDDEDSKTGLSTHEARMQALREQIAELEAENIGKKDWVMTGEVTSRARPQNALLEEDLEFERLAKAIPVITDDVVQDLEARIKARIVEGRFDDVVRKRATDDKPFLPSRIFELQDTKSKESLAQIYENEFMASQTGGTTDDRDGKLQKEHEAIEQMWEGICYKLDALCNAHFTPKQPKATISTVSNISAVSLESALPTAKAASTILAPEEVFAPKAADLRSKSELTPAEKQSLRLKERKKKKKQRDVLDKSVDKFAKVKGMKGVKQQKEAALKSIVKNGKGVTVIGKKSQDIKKGKGKQQRP